MIRTIHILSASIALLTIASFWTASILSEVFASHDTVALIKASILQGMLLLIPAMATAGITGNLLGKGWRLPVVAQKTRRMKIIAANGLLLLLPSAVFLAMRAQDGQFDSLFYAVQTLELVAGAVNITLLSLNMKAGMALRTRRMQRS